MVDSTIIFVLSSVLLSIFIRPTSSSTTIFNVLNHGAKPDGKTDSSPAFLHAWNAACSSEDYSTTVHVPQGIYLLRPVTFQGKCKSSKINMKIEGRLVAPVNYNILGKAANWLLFHQVSGVSIYGGVIDARGESLWACKRSKAGCPFGATSLEFTNSKNIMINGLSSVNSQGFHIVINECHNVRIGGAAVVANRNSPNTDGIHLGGSSHVTITDASIKTGDDCISIGPGSRHLWIEHCTCGPGHGMSIGSLGQAVKERGVRNVTVKSVVFTGSENGVRIKTWAKPSNGFVKGVHFEDMLMKGVRNPIIIDQNYCPYKKKDCLGQASGIKINSRNFYHKICHKS